MEGVSGQVPHKGSVNDTLAIMLNNIKSGMSYAGVSRLEDLKTNTTYVKVSSASLLESKDRL